MRQPYPSFKDSRVDWIGNIPIDWIIVKLKSGMKRIKEKAYQENPIILSLTSKGVIKRDISSNEGQIAESYYEYNPVKKGDLLLNPMDLVSNAFSAVSEIDGVISQAYFNLRCFSGYCNKYYDYYFKLQYWSLAFYAHGKGVSFDHRWTLNSQTLMNYFIPYPSFLEQKQIASFLDNKTKLIDELIEKTKQKIELLKEKRTSLINHCVTKGLNPNVGMKDSGIKWIGRIPKGWEMSKLKYFSIITLGKMLTPEDKGSYHLKPYLRSQNVQINTADIDDIKEMWFSDNELKKYRLKKGDLLVNEGGDVGRTCMWENEIDECYIQNSINRVDVLIENKKYYQFHFYLHHQTGYFNSIVNRVSIPHLTKEKLENVAFIKPSLIEQNQIVEYLSSQTQKIDTLIDKENKRIELLKEYRQSLISETVTGKIDVRDEVAV